MNVVVVFGITGRRVRLKRLQPDDRHEDRNNLRDTVNTNHYSVLYTFGYISNIQKSYLQVAC